MGTYYEFKGTLKFASPTEAAAALSRLRALKFFWLPPPAIAHAEDLVVADSTLTFAFADFASDDESFIDATTALEELAAQALSGHVRVQGGEGNDDDGTEVYHFRAPPAP